MAGGEKERACCYSHNQLNYLNAGKAIGAPPLFALKDHDAGLDIVDGVGTCCAAGKIIGGGSPISGTPCPGNSKYLKNDLPGIGTPKAGSALSPLDDCRHPSPYLRTNRRG